jgi:hypothetical protein
MQLPRGTFLSIKRSTKFGDLFSELHSVKFTGVCTISYKTGNGTVVFKHGKHILAEFQNTTGDTAWDNLQKIISDKGDASLSTLNEAQIQLSLEFNKTCIIAKGGKTEKLPLMDIPKPPPLRTSLPPVSPQKQAEPAPGKTYQKTAIPRIIPVPEPGEVQQVRSPPAPKIISDSQLRTATQMAEIHLKTQVAAQKEGKKSLDLSQDLEDSESSFEMDIETFETMDVEAIRSKIHGECTSLIKELNLEHLTENQKGKLKR